MIESGSAGKPTSPNNSAGNPPGRPASAVGRYLFYAIGEIALVVIGILIALQINNWNEVRKDNKLENYLLQSLKEDLLNDIKELDGNIQDALDIEIGCIGLIEFQKGIPKNTEQLQLYVRYLGGVSFDINDLSYNEMSSFGTFKLLSEELRREIAKYYWTVNSYDGMRDDNLQLKRTTANLLQKYGCAPRAIILEDLRNALEDKQLIAVIKEWEQFGPYQARSHESFQSMARDLLERVENEISGNKAMKKK